MKYHQVIDGERRKMKSRDLLSMCCDCGLVHLIRLRVVRRGTKLAIVKQAWRMERNTAAARRGKKYKGLRLPK